jgi:hypothetical protein
LDGKQRDEFKWHQAYLDQQISPHAATDDRCANFSASTCPTQHLKLTADSTADKLLLTTVFWCSHLLIFRSGVLRQGFEKFYSVSFQARRSLVRYSQEFLARLKANLVTNFSFPPWQSLPPPLAEEVGEHQKISILLPPVLFFLRIFFAIFLKFHRLLDLVLWGKFLKFDSISCFVFLWDVYRVSLDPVIFCGACGAPITRPGGRATLSCPPGPRLAIAKPH